MKSKPEMNVQKLPNCPNSNINNVVCAEHIVPVIESCSILAISSIYLHGIAIPVDENVVKTSKYGCEVVGFVVVTEAAGVSINADSTAIKHSIRAGGMHFIY